MKRSDLIARLRAVGEHHDAAIDVADVALTLAALDRPDVAPDSYRRHLSTLGEAAQTAVKASAAVGPQVAGLREIMVRRFGYGGDRETYDDPRNANLMHVIDRRRGLPVALGILCLHAVRAYGGTASGLNFPSHFLIRLEGRGQRVILDPFDELRVVGAPDLRRRLKEMVGPQAEVERDHYRAVSDRDVLVRLQSNIKVRALAAGDLPRALEVLETLTALAPERVELWWETAMLHYRLGSVRQAIAVLEGVLDAASPGPDVNRIETLLRRLKTTLN